MGKKYFSPTVMALTLPEEYEGQGEVGYLTSCYLPFCVFRVFFSFVQIQLYIPQLNRADAIWGKHSIHTVLTYVCSIKMD